MDDLQFNFEVLQETSIARFKDKGGVKKGIVVDKVCLNKENDLVKYYLKHPNKYPEIILKNKVIFKSLNVNKLK